MTDDKDDNETYCHFNKDKGFISSLLHKQVPQPEQYPLMNIAE